MASRDGRGSCAPYDSGRRGYNVGDDKRRECNDEASDGQDPCFSVGAHAGTSALGNAMDASGARSKSTAPLPEYVAEELANMRLQLDVALREHRSREDRLISHLREQANASCERQELDHTKRSASSFIPPTDVVSIDEPLPAEVLELSKRLAVNDSEAPSTGGDKQLAATADRSTAEAPKRRHSVSPNMNGTSSQHVDQHYLSLEVSDLLDDLRTKRAKRSCNKTDSAGDAISYHDSMNAHFEHFAVKALEGVNACLHLHEPERTGIVASMLMSKYWVITTSCAIAFNAVFMIFQVDWQAAHYTSDVEPPLSMQCIEMVLIVFFLLEMLLKLSVHRLYYFVNDDMRWNVFDCFLVMLSLYDVVIAQVGQDAGGNLTFFRSLRILRMTRVLRVIRILKFAGQLRRMLLSILGSMSSLFWAFAVLLFVFYMFGILAVQSLSTKLEELPLWKPAEEVADLEAEVMLYFGSVSSAMLTYYTATSGGKEWSFFYKLLVQVSEFDATVLIFVVVFTQIALFNVLTGIFVENAMKVGKPDRDSLALEQRREELAEAKALRTFMADKLDSDSDGKLTFDEFRHLAQNVRVNSVFASMGLDVKDAKLFFEMINGGNEGMALELDFIVDACMKMKGPATSLDVQSLLYKMDRMSLRMDALANDALQMKSLQWPQTTADAFQTRDADEPEELSL